MGAGDIYFTEVNGHDENFFFFGPGLGEDFAGSAGNETLAPELNAVAREALIPDAIGDGHVAAIRDSVRALNSFPG